MDQTDDATLWIISILAIVFIAILIFAGFNYFNDGINYNDSNYTNYTENYTGELEFLNDLTKFVCIDDNRNQTVCTQEYDPVCGVRTDNENILQTYSNGCSACQDYEVQFWVEGECPNNN